MKDSLSHLIRSFSSYPDVRFALYLGAGWLFFLWMAYFLALAGAFSLWSIGGALTLAVASTWYMVWRESIRPSRELVSVILITAALAIWYGSFAIESPSVFTGRDQGSYSTAALHLAQTGHIAFSSPAASAFFDIYGPGKALNFPGFAYDSTGALVPQFPLGSIVWLAAPTTLFGIKGLALANGSAFFFGLVFFWSLLRRFIESRYAWLGLMLAAVSFPFVWFGRFTLSENLAWPLFLFLCFALVNFLETDSRFAYGLVWLSGLFLAFTRIEGWVFFVVAITIAFVFPAGRVARAQFGLLQTIVVPIIVSLALIAVELWYNLPFFRSLAGTLYHEWLGSGDTPSLAGGLATHRELWSILWLYGLAPVFVIGTASIAIFWKRRELIAFVPVLLALPTFLYFFDAHISGDHPWLLRRFTFSLWPALLFAAIVGIVRVGNFLQQRFSSFSLSRLFIPAFFTVFLTAQLFTTSLFLFRQENRLLLEQASALADRFGPNDLILVDRLASGDPWTLLAGPIQSVANKNAAYFFNMDDFGKLPLDRFDHVYFLVRSDETPDYLERFGNNHLAIADAYHLTPERFEYTKRSDARFPLWQTDDVYGFVLEYVK